MCNDCGKRFHIQREMEQHKKRMHMAATMICDLCPPDKNGIKKLYTEEAFKIHQLVHQRKNKCSRCANCYNSLSNLLKHYRIDHLKYLAFRCRVCNKRFTTRY